MVILDGSVIQEFRKLALANSTKQLIHLKPFGISEAQVMEVSGSLYSVHISGRRVLILPEDMQRQ